MNRFVESAKIVVLATHSEGLVRSVCNKVCVLDGGRMQYFGPTEEYYAEHAAA